MSIISKKVVILGIFLKKRLVSTCIEKPGFSCILDILKTTKNSQNRGHSFSSYTKYNLPIKHQEPSIISSGLELSNFIRTKMLVTL